MCLRDVARYGTAATSGTPCHAALIPCSPKGYSLFASSGSQYKKRCIRVSETPKIANSLKKLPVRWENDPEIGAVTLRHSTLDLD
jgi:hypothetical protein